MGAWGEGLMANDGALDAIGNVKASNRDLIGEFKADPEKLREHFRTELHGDAEGSLGLAEYLLNFKVKFSPQVKSFLEALVESELDEERLICWASPEDREIALTLFIKRVRGEMVDMNKVEQSNAGLFERMSDKMRKSGTE